MIPFLKQVARHYHSLGDIGRRCFIFPNRRSQVFFMKYLGESVKEAGVPVQAPEMMSIDDFFYKASGAGKPDRVDLLLTLYECYCRLNPEPEQLDDFIFWGDVILGDFDDVDKYLADPGMLFRNVAEFKDIQDSYSYLTETQRKALERFVGNFSRDGRLTVDPGAENPGVKEKFLRIWNLLLPLYNDFRAVLSREGKATPGMVYRGLADKMRTESAADVLGPVFGDREYVFVGLNALNECEKTVMRRIHLAGLAGFCWDYSSSMVRHPLNKSSFFMSRNVEEFPQAFRPDPDGLGVPEVEVVSVSSSVGQAKLLDSLVDDEETAVVLPDETLLVPVLNSIPPRIRDINVTMGYPMAQSAIYDFLKLVTAMQMHLRSKDGKWFFYHAQVWAIMSSNIFRKLTEGDEEARQKVSAVRQARKYYIPGEDLCGHPLFDLVFRPVVEDPGSGDPALIARLAAYQKDILKGIATYLGGDPDLAVELEFARAAYNAVSKLALKHLGVRPQTYARLLDRLLGTVSVPFNGEPLKGLQVMGPLETRCLDFPHVVILSCNEGMFPRRNVSSSFIPPELRKGFGLPTYEYQDAVWAYYFYRLIQRARKVSLVYDSRTEGIKSGEESRYIKQLHYHFNLPIRRRFASSVAVAAPPPPDIPKTGEDIETIRSRTLSASALKNYLDCPAKFYYSTVKGLKKKDEVAEDLDSGMLGDVFHKTMQALYSRPEGFVSKESLSRLAKDRGGIKEMVRRNILAELNSVEVTGRDLVVEDVIVEYVLGTLRRDIELLESSGYPGFEILGLELPLKTKIGSLDFVGYIDRLDSLRPGEVRVVDYKTGKVEDKDIDISDAKAASVVAAMFGEKNKGRPKIAFQLYLYDVLCRRLPKVGDCRIVNSVYAPASFFTEGVREIPCSEVFMQLAGESLDGLLAGLLSPEVPFARTSDPDTCKWCDFKMICGR